MKREGKKAPKCFTWLVFAVTHFESILRGKPTSFLSLGNSLFMGTNTPAPTLTGLGTQWLGKLCLSPHFRSYKP